jgi:magnesium chelatase family protein
MERVRVAIRNSGYQFPHKRITFNLAPANVRKEGPVYDLPIALATLSGGGTIESGGGRPRLGEYLIAGELALDGAVRPVRGTVSMALLAKAHGARGVIVPAANAREAATVDGIEVRAAAALEEIVAWCNGLDELRLEPTMDAAGMVQAARPDVDFGAVRGQEAAKRAVLVAAVGGHNLLMIGPAGTGKTMMARALPGILPPLSRSEALDVTRIYSAAGLTDPGRPLIVRRPVRTPHHTASGAAIVGGGTIPRPGEVSLAHRGVLFLDELPEFGRTVLETLRQPLEDGVVTIARAQATLRFPARFMLVAALNPTARGDGRVAEGSPEMLRYLSRISGPLVDRIDIHVEVPAVPFRELSGRASGTSTAVLRERVAEARDRQRARQGAVTNSELAGGELDRHLLAEAPALHLLREAMEQLGLSARADDKVRRVARSVADIDGVERVDVHHMAEAVQYRLLDRMLA